VRLPYKAWGLRPFERRNIIRKTIRHVLIIVPGILGSCLARDGRLIWGGPKVARAFFNPTKALGLRGDGLSPDPGVEAVGLIKRPAQFPGLSKNDIYDDLVKHLEDRFVLDETNYLVFPYDWRLSCEVNAKILAYRAWPLLEKKRRSDPGAKLVFICHSMGGLVVQYFTDTMGGASETHEVITLGTPFRGSIKALGVMTKGWPPSLPVLRQRFRSLALTLPSVYELLPSYRAIIQSDQLRVVTRGDLPEDARDDLFSRARRIMAAMDHATVRAYGRTVIVGSAQPTPQFADVGATGVKILHQWVGRDGPRDERGDGTVPRQSVTPPEWPDDRHAIPLPQTHIGLPSTSLVHRILANVLTATPREEQAESRAKLAIEVPDLVPAGEPLTVGCEVAEGDAQIPLLVELTPLDDWRLVQRRSPRPVEGGLAASFPDLSPGDYRVSVASAVPMPDVRSVWDLVTVVDPTVET